MTISISISIFTMFSLAAASTSPVPWFREKYLKETQNEYYIYTFSRWQLDDNDIDICPEIHKSAIYFAVTGLQLWRESPLTHATYRERERAQWRRQRRLQRQLQRESMINYSPHTTAYDIRWRNITIADIAWFLIDFHQYCYQQLIQLLSVLMATLTTIILCILVFCQY